MKENSNNRHNFTHIQYNVLTVLAISFGYPNIVILLLGGIINETGTTICYHYYFSVAYLLLLTSMSFASGILYGHLNYKTEAVYY